MCMQAIHPVVPETLTAPWRSSDYLEFEGEEGRLEG